MKPLKHYHTIKVRFLGVTNTKPARMVIETERFKQRKYLSFSLLLPGVDNTKDKAQYILEKNGFNLVGYSSMDNHYLFFTDTFKALESKVYNIVYKGEIIDTFETKSEAKAMKKEYDMAHKYNHTIKKETQKFQKS